MFPARYLHLKYEAEQAARNMTLAELGWSENDAKLFLKWRQVDFSDTPRWVRVFLSLFGVSLP